MTGEPISPEQVEAYEASLRRRQLVNYEVAVSRVNLSPQEVAQLSAETARNLVQEMQLQAELQTKPRVQTTQSPSAVRMPPTAQLLREVQTVFPAVQGIQAGRLRSLLPDTSAAARADTLVSVLVQWRPTAVPNTVGRRRNQPDTPALPNAEERSRLYRFLQVRLRQDTLALGIRE
jgi:hypothetical protein